MDATKKAALLWRGAIYSEDHSGMPAEVAH